MLKRVLLNPRTKQHKSHTSHRANSDASISNSPLLTTRLIQQSTKTRGCRRNLSQATVVEMGKKSGKSVTVQQVKEASVDPQVEPSRVRKGNSQGGGQEQKSRSRGIRSGDTLPTTNMGNLPTVVDTAEIFHDVSLDTNDSPMDVTALKDELDEIESFVGSRDVYCCNISSFGSINCSRYHQGLQRRGR
jgi:hypothetical protein